MNSKKNKHLLDFGKGHRSVCGVRTFSGTLSRNEVNCKKCVEISVKENIHLFNKDILLDVFDSIIKKMK